MAFTMLGKCSWITLIIFNWFNLTEVYTIFGFRLIARELNINPLAILF